MRRSESGNIIFFILIAIVMIGLVTAALRSGGLESANIDREDLSIKISQVRQNAGELERAVTLVMQNGISESAISFASPDAPSDYGTYDANAAAEVFNPKGGGARYRRPPSGINDGSGWEFYGSTVLPNVGSDQTDLVAVLPHVTKAFCDKVNAANGQTAQQPTDTGECVNGGAGKRFKTGVLFITASPNTMDDATFTRKPATEACVECPAGATYNYYHLLMGR